MIYLTLSSPCPLEYERPAMVAELYSSQRELVEG